MTRFRPCIDLHQGKVKQIIGGSYSDTGRDIQENFISAHPSEWYAELYRRDGLAGGHVIMLGPGNEEAALRALRAWPGGLQVGGGIHPGEAGKYLDAGASHLIVTSWLFPGLSLDLARLQAMEKAVGKDRLVVDLSCRMGSHRGWVVAKDRWRTLTDFWLTRASFERVAPHCAEFLVHAADIEGLQAGIAPDLVTLLGTVSPLPVTYAGGAKETADLELVKTLSKGRVDLTIGSSLDIFGGAGARYQDCVAWNRTQPDLETPPAV